MLKDSQQVTLIQSLYLQTRKWGSGEVTWLAQGHRVELITEWRRCPQSPDSQLLRKLQNKLTGREITSERQQSHWSLGEPPLLEEPWEPSWILHDSPQTDSLPSNEQRAGHSRAAPRTAWWRAATKSLSAVYSSYSALWPKDVYNWTCNNFIEKKQRVFNRPKLYKEILGMNFAKHNACTELLVFLKPPTRSFERRETTETTEQFLEGRDFLWR